MECSRSPVAMGTSILLATYSISSKLSGSHRVLEELRVELLDPRAEYDRLGRGQPPVYLDAEVDVVADRLAVRGPRSRWRAGSSPRGC